MTNPNQLADRQESLAWGVRDSVSHEIPVDELNPRSEEVEHMLELLQDSSLIVITGPSSGTGKTTFGAILRHSILAQNPPTPDIPDCLMIVAGDIASHFGPVHRQDRFTRYDGATYPSLIQFSGLIIIDEVNPEQFPLVQTLTRAARVACIIQPNFLDPKYVENALEQELIDYICGNNIPVVDLDSYRR